MSFERKANLMLAKAEELAATAESWGDFSNAIFDQRDGLVAQTFADPVERQAFYDSEQYQDIYGILRDLIRKFGVAQGATPTKSGRFVVRIPRTLHTTLDVEAKSEGVSLNQLVSSKLAWPLRQRLGLDSMLIAKAFADVHRGFASDRVLVDPELNAEFLRVCAQLGLTQDPYHLNHALLDVRKSKKAKLPPTTRPTEFRDMDAYQFGAEIAVRSLQRTTGASLDRILCDPKLALEFDRISATLADEPSVLKRRWAALNLRKTRRLKPSDLQGPTYRLESAGPIRSIPLQSLPEIPATYAIYDESRPVYAGETANLRERIRRHLEPGRLPEWVDASDDTLTLRLCAVHNFHANERQRWLRQFINSERPLLNYQRTA